MHPKPYYLTTPIYYVNARPHLGHTYTTVVADVLARFHRTQGEDVWFLTGTDEHGQKIQRSARARGESPQQFTDEVAAEFRGLWDRMRLTYDDFIRTTEPRHQRGAQKLFALLRDRGFIYKGSYTGQYCVFDELYVDGPPGTFCPDCGRLTETVSEENYYFKLSAFERILDERIYQPQRDGAAPREGQFRIEPETRRNEVLSFVRGGLRDLSVSRTSFDWGVPVPGDEKHIIYVWLDALANYITALGWGSDNAGKFARYWPADLHIIGKEISRFHCVYWPAFLIAAGLPLPKQIVAHGWLLFEQSKMSKSRGNIVRAETVLEVLGSDALRYFLLREIPFGQDGSFSFDALVQRYNADLANGYGNLASRTLAMIAKYFDGIAPEYGASAPLDATLGVTPVQISRAIAELRFTEALENIWSLVSITDGYLTREQPWKVAADASPEAREKLSQVLGSAAEAIRIITALAHPILPEGTAKVWEQLGLGDIAQADLKNIRWGGLEPGTKLGALGPVYPRAEKDAVTRMQTMEEQNNPKPAAEPAEHSTDAQSGNPHSPRNPADPSGALATPPAAQLASSYSSSAEPNVAEGTVPASPAPPKAETAPATPAQSQVPAGVQTISIEDFTKVELRVAQIKVAERVPKADKLLRLEVDLGYEQRQILAGIAEHYAPESLIGRRIVIVANLAPRKMRGLESQGMLLAASVEGGKPVLATFAEDIELGARLK